MAGDLVKNMLIANPSMLNNLKLKMLLAKEKADKSDLIQSNRKLAKRYNKGGVVTNNFKGTF